jgi:elongation factor 1 alpha-like protein
LKQLEEERELDRMMAKKIQKAVEEEEVIDHKVLNQIYPEVHYTSIVKSDDGSTGLTKLNLVIIGHVDSGKSTLMGHLLLKMGRVDKQEWHKVEKLSDAYGKSSFKFAYLLD